MRFTDIVDWGRLDLARKVVACADAAQPLAITLFVDPSEQLSQDYVQAFFLSRLPGEWRCIKKRHPKGAYRLVPTHPTEALTVARREVLLGTLAGAPVY